MVRLPVPPSTNNLYINLKHGRMVSPAYKAWRLEAGLKLNLRKSDTFGTLPVQVGLMVPRKPKSRDIDNFAKAPIDLLVAHGIIADDKHIERLTISRHDDPDILITVTPV